MLPASRSQVALFNHQKAGGCNYNNSKARSAETHQGDVILRELWRWLIEHSIPRDKTDELSRRALLSIYNQKRPRCRSREMRAIAPIKSKELLFISLRQFSNLEPID